MKKFIRILTIIVLVLCLNISVDAASTYSVKQTSGIRYQRKVTVKTNGVKKTYKVYDQTKFGSTYLSQRGCAHTAAAIIMSAYGKPYTSDQIHAGSVQLKCSERYALKTLHKKVAVTGQSLSVYSISKILANVGIKNHPVYVYKKANAIKEITKNLESGRPVIIMCHRKTVNGIRLANSYHMLVLAGIDRQGKAIVLNPAGGTVNRSHCTGNYRLSVKELVKNHMWSCTGSGYRSFYFNRAENYGGYILVKE